MKFKIIIIIISSFLFSCKEFQEIQVTNIDGFNLTALTLENLEAQIQVKIKNPNSKGFNIYPSEFEVVFGGMRLGRAKLNRKVRIHANSEEVYSFKLNSNLSEINPMDALNLLNMGSQANIVVKGDLKVGKFYFKKKLPVNYMDKVKFMK
ncbi:MAG: LEA type 2 family protein [Burkholderiales bacterium]|nr:LEA type 2 family protein [Bacteroidia bacterium]